MEKRRPHENTILDNQANRKQLNTRRRIFHSAVGADSASREGAARMIVAKQLKKRDKSQKSVWTACVHGRRKGRENVGFVVGQRKSDESCGQLGGSESTGDWTCRRLMAWLREIGLGVVDIIVKSDNEPALTSLIES